MSVNCTAPTGFAAFAETKAEKEKFLKGKTAIS
jgi:hypothetical protein